MILSKKTEHVTESASHVCPLLPLSAGTAKMQKKSRSQIGRLEVGHRINAYTWIPMLVYVEYVRRDYTKRDADPIFLNMLNGKNASHSLSVDRKVNWVSIACTNFQSVDRSLLLSYLSHSYLQ